MEPSPHLQNEVARRLGDLGVSDADRKAYGIASAAIRMAVPEALEQIARAHRSAEFAIRRTDQELAELPSLRYALSLYANGLADGGRFARQTLRPAAVDAPGRRPPPGRRRQPDPRPRPDGRPASATTAPATIRALPAPARNGPRPGRTTSDHPASEETDCGK